jgi:hypothetical protein
MNNRVKIADFYLLLSWPEGIFLVDIIIFIFKVKMRLLELILGDWVFWGSVYLALDVAVYFF